MTTNWPTTTGVMALCTDIDAATAIAEQLAEDAATSWVSLYSAATGHTGPFVAVVRVAGDVDVLAPKLAGVAATGLYAAHFRRVRDYPRDWADGAETPGLTATFALVRRADLSHEQADGHWRDNHAPLALKHHVGMWGYTQCSIDRILTPGSAAFDGVALCQFASLSDLKERFFDGPEGVKAIREDVAKMADTSASPSLRTVERILKS